MAGRALHPGQVLSARGPSHDFRVQDHQRGLHVGRDKARDLAETE